ncbi:MAG TPA: hypothetical protein VGU46_12900 [Acidobacteriaceae bacterium]|nr:hypothetical protein [Acidobacteriaceae bacterium]
MALTEVEIESLNRHLTEVLEGEAFRGSHRSGQFLAHIMREAIAGRFESLKERVIGVELFGRNASYDTGADAIVRVTASDVRKRLLQHYVKSGSISGFHISLPTGAYLPEITRVITEREAVLASRVVADGDESASRHTSASALEESISFSSAPEHIAIVPAKGWRKYQFFLASAVLVALNLALWGFLLHQSRHKEAAHTSILPWSAFFASTHVLHLITSDPTIDDVQAMLGSEISISDYANHRYPSAPNGLSPGEKHLFQDIHNGDKAASVDVSLAVRIAELVQANSGKMDVRPARTLQITGLKSDDNFIFLGSPRSDPWFSLFDDQLDFRFVYDKSTRAEFIRNYRPQQNEQQVYMPSVHSWGNGESYAIVAFVKNPSQNGQVVLVAGEMAEGTEAAGELATNLVLLSTILKKCGIVSAGPMQHFEILLRLNAMAYTSVDFDPVACHVLPDAPVRKDITDK